jgi:hypothetical protein
VDEIKTDNAPTQITIVLNEKCCPEVNPTPIGKTHAIITWTRKDGTKVENVDIENQLSFFEAGQPNGNDWTVKYNGSSGAKSWNYSTRCSDTGCSDGGVQDPSAFDARVPPQMNNEGG